MGTRRNRPKLSTAAHLAAALLSCAVAAAAADGLTLEIVPLQHSTVDDVLPLLRPMVAPGGTITGMRDQLIIKTTAENLSELKRLLTVLDRAPKSLRITVRQDVAASSLLQEDAVSGRFKSGDFNARLPDPGSHDGASIGIHDGTGRNTIRYRAINTRSTDDSRNTHFVTAIEGRPALIQTGQSIPYPYLSGFIGPYGAGVIEGIDYKDVNSGFYVTPRTQGQRVTLEIAPRLERENAKDHGVIDTRYSSTTVSGRLGEWIPIGGTDQAASGRDSALVARTRRYDAETYNIWVKVEEIP
jgi:type II secretory pathway component GspD/PulD (secretin)